MTDEKCDEIFNRIRGGIISGLIFAGVTFGIMNLLQVPFFVAWIIDFILIAIVVSLIGLLTLLGRVLDAEGIIVVSVVAIYVVVKSITG